MKIGAVADTHGNVEYVKKVASLLVDEEKVEEIVHLGDDYKDADLLEEYAIKLARVPGVYEDFYKDPGIPNRVIKDYNGWKVLLTHSPTSHGNDLPQDLKPEEVIAKKEVKLVLYAHTHIPKLEEKDGILLVNPGHLKRENKKGFPASYAILNFGKERIDARIIDLLKRSILQAYEFR